MAFQLSYKIQDHCSGVALPTVAWSLLDQLVTKETVTELLAGQSDEGDFPIDFSLPGCAQLMAK